MNQINTSEIDKFIQQFPKDEIITTLNTINTKISALHSISSKDFLYFNSLLKKYYPKIKDIEEANNILSIFFSENLPNITKNIKEKNTALKTYIDTSKSNNHKVIELLSIIYSSFDMVIVPFNNYKQNLITFKYLLANLKLHLGYVDFANNQDLTLSVAALEEHITNIYTQIEDVATHTNTVVSDLLHLKEFADIAHEDNNEKIFIKLKNITQQSNKLIIEDYLPQNITLDLARRTQNCFASMGDVITNIQYHDIIRQKMEHIQSSQETLIDGLKDIQTNTKQAVSLDERLNFIVKIPEITDIQVAQLLYTNKDYQTSIEKITNKLISVGHELKEINGSYKLINNKFNQLEDSTIADLILSQESLDNYVKSIHTNCINVSTKFNNLYKSYNQLKQDYNSIFNNEKSLRKEIKNFEHLIGKNGKQVGKELVKRLIQLLTNLQSNSNSLKSNLNNITTKYRNLNNLISNFNCEEKIFEIGTGEINNLKQQVRETKNTTKDITTLSLTISEEITSSLKKIEYYTFFKNTVEEIVGLLNNMNQKTNYTHLKNMIGDNKEILHKIEQLYTMKSERDIHQMLTKSEKNISQIVEEENNDIDNMDIELF